MRPVHHVMISGGVSTLFAIWVESVWAIGACFLSGIFIDLDHHFDYMISRKELPLSYKKLLDFLEKDHSTKLYLFLHSHELLLLFWMAIFYFSLGEVWIGVAVGFTTHILCDEIANPFRPLAYFLTYRIKHQFNRKMLFKESFFDNVPSAKTH